MGNSSETQAYDTEADECYFTNRRGNRIFMRSYLPPEDVEPKVMIILAHGLFGHSGRQAYKNLAQYLNPKGCAIFGLDHEGHGNSFGERAYIQNFTYYFDDLEDFVQIIIQKYQPTYGKPFILGHSLGGCIVLGTVLRNQSLYQGMILNGAALWFHEEPRYLTLAAEAMGYLLPKQKVLDEDIYKLSRNKEACDGYANDPLVCTKVGVRSLLLSELIRINGELYKVWSDLSVPFLLLHGDADETCNPLGSKTLYNTAASTDKQLVLLEGFFHEPWEDPESEKVFKTIWEWIEGRLPQKE